MLTITDGGSLSRALTEPINSDIHDLLTLRQDQLGGDIAEYARFVVVQPGDVLNALEHGLGFSVFQNPADGTLFGEPDFTPGWEWMEDHGHCFELVFILTDDGFAHVVLIEKAAGTDPELLRLCTAYVTEQA